MQHPSGRRTNLDRSAATRAQLIAAARTLFVAKGYADTATPDIVEAAGVTRGALYHHFADKRALFRAVAEVESAAVAGAIEKAAPPRMSPRDALVAGGEAWLAAMASPGRTRLLLLDGPAVLGRRGMDEIDARYAAGSLRAGLEAAARAGVLPVDLPVGAVASLLSSAYDRATLEIAEGADATPLRQALAALIDGLCARAPAASTATA